MRESVKPNPVDATECRPIDHALRESEERFRSVFQEARIGMAIVSLEGRFLGVNRAFCEFIGYSEEELLRKDVESITYSEDLPRTIEIRTVVAQGKQLPIHEKRYVHKDGQVRWGEVAASVVHGVDGQPKYFLAQVLDIADRKRSQEARLRFAALVESSDDAIIGKTIGGIITTWNKGAEQLYGYQAEEVIGIPISLLAPPEFSGDFHEIRAKLWRGETVKNYETVRQRKDGVRINVSLTVSPVKDLEGRVVGSSAIAHDISERKRQEAALRESEERFRLMADSAPALIWMTGTDKLCTFFNQGWLRFTGRSMEQELGEGWTAGVHTDDLERCLDTYSEAFDARVDFEMEYRLRRFDGDYRWILDCGVPRFGSDGTFCGYIGSCVDITERKLSEMSLRELSGRLIQAQEEERARIARELHDDISQRMALLSVDLERFEQGMSDLSSEAREQLHNMSELASEVASDLHNLSRQLHPARLDLLGLVAAVGHYCREVSKKQDLRVEFVHRDVGAHIPKDVSLCLFRIVQETLQNVVKHGRTLEAKVEMSGHKDGIDLCISDTGAGFNLKSAEARGGLGLISMRERLRLIGGRLTLESAPLHGTRISVHVPLHSGARHGTSEQKQHEANA